MSLKRIDKKVSIQDIEKISLSVFNTIEKVNQSLISYGDKPFFPYDKIIGYYSASELSSSLCIYNQKTRIDSYILTFFSRFIKIGILSIGIDCKNTLFFRFELSPLK